MSIRIVRLGSPRLPDEGVRLGTVRRPPRGIRKDRIAALDYYDVWLPILAPSPALFATARAIAGASDWARFRKRFRGEMSRGDAGRVLDALAALSRTADFSVGCYCEDASRCHRSVLRELLLERGALLD